MKSIILVSTTFERHKDAERLAELLLHHKLAACAQISGPITSLYRWEGKLTRSSEFLLHIKTTAELFEDVSKLLTKEHPYELPEIIAVETHLGDSDYIKWIYGEVLP